MKRNPELMVPIRDRRKSKRILTLRNFRNFTLIALGLFGVITVASEMRDSTADDYGRLYGHEVKKAPQAVPRPVESAIVAAPVPENESADPLLLNAAAREQYLGVTEPLQPVTTTVPAPPPAAVPEGRVAIVGGAEGVAIVKTDDRLPKLGGGFMRPNGD